MLKFDDKTTAFLDDAYQGADIVKRRLLNLDVLAPKPAERIADIGCGPGHLTLELSRAVGEHGQVTGIDPAPDMRKAAEARCAGRPNTKIVDGVAADLPLENGSIDKAISLQVFEYLNDIPAALNEIRRVLKPGGRLVVGDMHWDTLTWHSENPERMARMLKAWDAHFTERRVPAILPAMMRQTGFDVTNIVPLTFLDTTFRADGIARMCVHLMRQFALQNSLLELSEVEEWAAEQQKLAQQGKFFFSFTHIIVAGRTS